MKVALIEAGHWHVPLYLPAFEEDGLSLTAVSDSLTSKGAPIAARFGATFYQDHRTLLDKEQVDFVFAFGRHIDMPGIAEDLIARRIPFAIEKPCGRTAADVRHIRLLAEDAGVYVAIPFVLRYTDIVQRLRAAAGGGPLHLQQAALRFIAGPIGRYDAAECSWLRDRDIAGGGSLMNVGHHFYDLLLALADEPIAQVSALMNFDGSVDDYSHVSMRGAGGLIASIDTGYRFPLAAPGIQRDFSVRLATENAYLILENDQLIARRHGTQPNEATTVFPVEMDVYYQHFVRGALNDYRAGRAPRAGLGELEAVMRVIDAAYASADQQGAFQTP